MKNYYDIEFWEELIDNQFSLLIQEKQFSINDLTEFEKLKYKFNISIQLLSELGCKNEK